MHGRVALITGAGSGVGAAAARAFAREGARVALAGRRREPLAAMAADIEQAGGRALAVGADITQQEDVARLVAACRDQLGGLDVLVNNAGLFQPAPAAACTLESWQEHLAVNSTGPFLLCREAYIDLKRSGHGVIVNVLTNLAQRPVAGTAAYSASKAALLSLTQCLALEWAKDGIRVVAVAPGVVDTPIHSDRGRLDAMAPMHPLGRVGRAEEVADAILFLASDRSGWTTGAVLNVDGGIGLA